MTPLCTICKRNDLLVDTEIARGTCCYCHEYPDGLPDVDGPPYSLDEYVSGEAFDRAVAEWKEKR